MGVFEECCIVDCVMIQIFFVVVFGIFGFEDEDVGSEQGFDCGQIVVRQGFVEMFCYGDCGFCSDWDVDVCRCCGSGVMCVWLCCLCYCGGYDGQCQCEGE